MLEKVTSRHDFDYLSDCICPNSGENHMLFHCCFIQSVEESERSEANTWCGSQRWHVVRMRYCFFIHLYQALLIDREMEKDGRKRENMC